MSNAALIVKVQDAFWHRAEHVLLHHTNPWELDETLEAFGYRTGPCVAQDHLGLDRVLARRQGQSGPVLPRMVAEGRLGKIGGVGFYRYPGGGGAVIDPLIEDLIREEAWFAKVDREERAPETLVAQMNAALADLRPEGLGAEEWARTLARAVGFPPQRADALDS